MNTKTIERFLKILRSAETLPLSWLKENPKTFCDAIISEPEPTIQLWMHETKGGFVLLRKQDFIDILSICHPSVQVSILGSFPPAIRLRELRANFGKLTTSLAKGEIPLIVFLRKNEDGGYSDLCLLKHETLFSLFRTAYDNTDPL